MDKGPLSVLMLSSSKSERSCRHGQLATTSLGPGRSDSTNEADRARWTN